MIINQTCDLCGWNNDNNDGPCRKCGGQTKEKLIRGKWRTVIVRAPEIELHGYYNPAVMQLPVADQ
jgi:hypothetical protein